MNENTPHIITITGQYNRIVVPADMPEVECHIQAGAHAILIDDTTDSAHAASQHITIYCAQDSHVTYYALMLNKPEYEKQIRIVLQGRHAHAAVRGLYLLDGEQRVQVSSRQEHHVPDTTSDLVIKGVLFGKSQALYEGVIHVDHGATGSNANQQNKNLLMSAYAQAKSVPALEVLTNKVTCKHGSAAGSVDPLQLFYLQSRGMSVPGAHKILVAGFIADLVEEGDILQEHLNKALPGLFF